MSQERYAPQSLGAPALLIQTDYSVFKKTAEQKSDTVAAIMLHRKFMKKNGLNPKKHLNIPAHTISPSIIINT